MNDIIKVILLNFILVYFLIKKNKSVSMFLIVVLFMYLLYLRGNELLEGQSNMDEKKDEVKFMKMANLDRLLGKLLNVYEHSEEDCIGGYTDFTPCDKKCGITHKYKTYRVKRKAGLFGKSCVEEDGRRKKELCDESDGVYKCIIGESCKEDGDCDSDNCDPRTDRCVSEKVCSNTNLDLCNKEECIDLNNHYDYAKREFKYDEAEPGIKCKLEDKETDSEDEEEEDDRVVGGLDPSIIEAADCEGNELYWYLEHKNRDDDRVTSTGCKLKIPDSVFYESEDSPGLQERKIQYGKDDLIPGLYCKIGNKFCPSPPEPEAGAGEDQPDEQEQEEEPLKVCTYPNNDMLGVTYPIIPEYIKDISSSVLENYCNHSINEGGECKEGYWPPYSYFEQNRNPDIFDQNLTIPIDDRCKRCDNGYKKSGTNECEQCTHSFAGGTAQTTTINQYIIVDNEYQNIDGEVIGNNSTCGINAGSDGITCESSQFSCNQHYMLDILDRGSIPPFDNQENFWSNCCHKCPINQKFNPSPPPPSESTESDVSSNSPLSSIEPTESSDLSQSNLCQDCPPGQYQNDIGNDCINCSRGRWRDIINNQCTLCGENQMVSDDGLRCIGVTSTACSNWDISNGHCKPKSGRNINVCGDADWCLNLTSDIPNRRQKYLDNFNDTADIASYQNCCEFRGCPNGLEARALNKNTKEFYCEDCPDVCGINDGSTQGMDSSICSCQPNVNYTAVPGKPYSNIFGEWNIGRYSDTSTRSTADTGTWIFLIPSTVVSLIGEVSDTSENSRLSIIGRLNGTETFNHNPSSSQLLWARFTCTGYSCVDELRQYFMDSEGGGQCSAGDDGWCKYGEPAVVAPSRFTTLWDSSGDPELDQTVGGRQYRTTTGVASWSNAYTSKWVEPDTIDPDIYFYSHIWNTLKDMYVLKSGESTGSYSALVREVAIAIYLSKEDLCNYCQSNTLVINTNNIRWLNSREADYPEYQTLPNAPPNKNIIIDFRDQHTSAVRGPRNNICKYCSNNYSPPPAPGGDSTFDISSRIIGSNESTSMIEGNERR